MIMHVEAISQQSKNPEAAAARPLDIVAETTVTPAASQDDEDDEQSREEEHQCYICWEAGTTANPIRRDCGCSGSAGLAHVECLIEAARTRSGDSLLDPILRQWAKCNQCQEPYTGETKEALIRAMAEDRRKTWKKRAVATLGTWTVTLIFCALYFACVCSMDKVLIHLYDKMDLWWEQFGPALKVKWEESSMKFQALAVGIFIGFVAAMAGVVWNDIKEMFVRHLSMIVMLMVMMDVAVVAEQPETYGVAARLGHSAVWIASLGGVAYRNRFALRDELIQVRREGLLSAILGAVFFLFLIGMYAFIDGFIGEVLPDKIENADRATSYVLERLLSFVGWDTEPTPSFDEYLDRARDQFWYCST